MYCLSKKVLNRGILSFCVLSLVIIALCYLYKFEVIKNLEVLQIDELLDKFGNSDNWNNSKTTAENDQTSIPESDILIKFYDFKNQTTDKTLNCIKTRLQPPFFVCVYPVEKDVFISKDLVRYGSWELGVALRLIEILNKNPTSIFLDIGANIGYYTLLAAKLGHPVLAVEPTPDHLKRIHRALELENLTDKVVLLQNALGIKRELVNIYVSKTNQGDNLVVPKNSSGKNLPSNSHDLSSVTVNSLMLNDLISILNSKISSPQGLKSTPTVMKIDIQAMESTVLATGDYFFDNTNVILVMMEWEPVIVGDVGKSNLKLYSFFGKRNFRPLNSLSGNSLEGFNMTQWPNDVWWIKK